MDPYGIPTIASKDLQTVNSPIIGLESENVYFSKEEGVVLLKIEQDDADSGETIAVATSYSIPAGGLDSIQLRAEGPIIAPDNEITIVLDVTTDSGSDTATATVAPPQFADDGSGVFGIGAGWDFIVDSAHTRKIVSIDGIDSISGGQAGNKFEIVALPNDDSWVPVSCVRSKEPTLPVPNTVNIACGKESAKYTKSGRTEIPNLQLSQANVAYGASLTKLNGHRVSIRVDIKDDSRILKERQIYTGYRGSGSPSLGDGEDESEVTIEGQFEKFIYFNAETDLS